jgi:hypothetical protein
VYPVKGKEKCMTTPDCPGHRGNPSDNTSVNAEDRKEKASPTDVGVHLSGPTDSGKSVNADEGVKEKAVRPSVEDPPEYA